jgi:hypothetical protein
MRLAMNAQSPNDSAFVATVVTLGQMQEITTPETPPQYNVTLKCWTN